jgi:hypothetical protein
MNTVVAGIDDATAQGTIQSVKHTINSLDIVTPKAIAKNVELWISKSDQVEKALNYFTSVKMNAESFLAFATGIFTNEKSDNLSTVSFNRVNDMLTLFQRGKGNHGETLSDAINAFTEYFTHGAGVGNPRNVSENKRLANANFGQGAQWKLEAIRVASNEELLAAAMQRGEMFYTDKLKAEARAIGGSATIAPVAQSTPPASVPTAPVAPAVESAPVVAAPVESTPTAKQDTAKDTAKADVPTSRPSRNRKKK